MPKTLDRDHIQNVVKQLIIDLLDDGCSPQDVIEGFEEELDRFETLVYDYE